MDKSAAAPHQPPLAAAPGTKVTTRPFASWELEDFERRLFFPAGTYTNVNPVLAFLLGLILSAIFYGLVLIQPKSTFSIIWLERGWIPYAICIVFFWGCSILFIKWRKLVLQRQALRINIVPVEGGFVLSPQSADQILEALYRQVQDPEKFVLFNRILRALSNLKNMGRVSDVETITRSQSENDSNALETSYTVLKGLIWTMPVLGFIGTVQGLSMAIGQFGVVLAAGGEMSALRDSLKSVVLGLSVAFDTTFEGLVCTLILQLALTFFRKQEENFYEECDSYCHRNIVSRLRLLGNEANT